MPLDTAGWLRWAQNVVATREDIAHMPDEFIAFAQTMERAEALEAERNALTVMVGQLEDARVRLDDECTDLRVTMQRCADKLEMRGNEEPLEVARVLRADALRDKHDTGGTA